MPEATILPPFLRLVCLLRCACAAGALWAAGPAVHAECPAWPSQLPATAAARTQALADLEARADDCARDAGWHARRGALLLALGRHAEAAESLERALLLAPEYAAARIDYADALAALGDLDSARSLARQLLALAEVPPAARDHLDARLIEWEVAATPWYTQREFALSAGWESNLNGGPAASSIWLTLPEGPLNLPLAASERPREGAAVLYDANLAGVRAWGADARLLLRGQGRLRDAPGGAFDYLIAQADAAWLAPSAAGGEWMVQASHLEQGLSGQRLFAETRLIAQHEWLAPACQPRLGGDQGWRRFPAASVLDGVQTGLRAGLRCVAGAWQLQGDVRVARDHAQHPDRPGGDQRWAELRLRAGWQAGARRAELEAGFARVRDEAGYSPLLDDARRRSVRRQTLRLELGHRLHARWELAAGIDAFRQRSSLALFELDNVGLYFGASYRY